MATVLNEDAITDWLVEYLDADSELTGMLNGGIAPEVRPPGWLSPFVRVDRLEGEDLIVVGPHRVWTETRYHVYGCHHWRAGDDVPDRSTVNAIGARLDELLGGPDGNETQTTTHSIHSFREEAEPTPALLDNRGELWLQAGGIYLIRAYPL